MIYKLSLRKAFGTPFNVKWSNTWYFDAANDIAAGDAGIDIWTNYERTFHTQGVYCYEIYVNNTNDPPNSPGMVFPVDQPDQRGTFPGYNAGATFPLWNCVRVDFGVVASRPSRKFYRVGLVPVNYDSGNVTGALATAIQTACTGIAGLANVVDVDGQQVFNASLKGLTPHRLGNEAGLNVPAGPPFG